VYLCPGHYFTLAWAPRPVLRHMPLDRTVQNKPMQSEKLAHSAVIGALYGAMPDILEPPTNRFHRKFFHSFTTLGAFILILRRVEQRQDYSAGFKAIRSSLLAYMTHLLLDSRTPMGLPLIF